MLKKLLLASIFVLASVFPVFADTIKIGFIYVGPVGDHGWTYMHDQGRQAVEKQFGAMILI